MILVERVFFRTLLLLGLLGFFAWSHPDVRINGSNVSGYVVQNGTTYETCKGMNSNVTGHVIREGQHFNIVRFSSGPCSGRWAWVAKSQLTTLGGNTEANTCATCAETATRPANTDDIAAITGLLNPPNGYVPLPGSASRGLCSSFVDSSGRLGDYGQRTLAAIRQVDPSGRCFLGGGIPISSHVCPNYQSFSRDKKERFWVYLFASIAHDESSCRPNVSGDGGSSDGLFQMEYSNWDRRFRGRECYPRIPTNSRALKFQFECTASIMRDINCRRGKPLGNGNGNTIFWSQLQRPNGDISRMVSRFPGCQ